MLITYFKAVELVNAKLDIYSIAPQPVTPSLKDQISTIINSKSTVNKHYSLTKSVNNKTVVMRTMNENDIIILDGTAC